MIVGSVVALDDDKRYMISDRESKQECLLARYTGAY